METQVAIPAATPEETLVATLVATQEETLVATQEEILVATPAASVSTGRPARESQWGRRA